MNPFNSKEYWNNRFSSGTWEENGGLEQTAYFARIACSLLPDFVKLDLLKNHWTIVDVGCAEGEASALLAEQFPDCRLVGQDFSEEAIQKAREKYPFCDFAAADVYQKILPGDVVFSSNTLEHLEDPLLVMKRMCEAAKKYVILLLPFEDGSDCAEHINLFQLKSFPLHIGSFYLEYSRLADCAGIEGDDWRWPQILLVYTNSDYRPEHMTLQEVHSQYGTTCPCVEELSQKLELKKQDLYRLLSEKDAVIAEREGLQKELRKTEEDLAAAVSQGDQKAERIAAMETQLDETAKALAATESQRDQAAEQLVSSEEQRRQLMEQIQQTSDQLASSRDEREELKDQLQRMEEQLAVAENHRDEVLEKLAMVESQRNQMEKRLQQADADLKAAGETMASLNKKEEDLTAKYENLYAYSCARDDELTKIRSSRSYRFFLRFIQKPLQIGYRGWMKLRRMVIYLFTLRWGLLWREILSPMRKPVVYIKGKITYKKTYRAIREDLAGKTVFLFPPTLDWHMRLFQRPQQLSVSYTQKPGIAVIYLTKNIKEDHVFFAEKIMPHLWVVAEDRFDEIHPLLKYADKTVISLSWTVNIPYIEKVKADKLIYEYIDELEIFHLYGEKMIEDHNHLIKTADVTVCTATKLFNQVKDVAKNPILSPNGGDYAFFSKTSQYAVSPLIQNRISSYRYVLGYYGALASWFDYGLIKEVAQKKPKWLFVLVGMDYDGTLKESGILECENIIYIPPQPYQELPRFLKAFDIALIPFLINEITLSTSPVKLFEYMAAGKPILTSRMPECLKYESVRTYRDAGEFCALAEELLALKPEDPYWEVLKREALENTWDARTDEILNAIGLEGSRNMNANAK